MKQIIEYINQKYNPASIILYGSYANGTNGINSDFDALVISYEKIRFHDTSFVNGIRLDVFVYPASYFAGNYDCADFIQILDGNIILDNQSIGKSLKDNVISYMQNRPRKSKEELKADIDWCVKMLERTKRGDAEAMFRWHWLLVDSLEIFCDTKNHCYLGPKKTLKWMEENYPVEFGYYEKALHNLNVESLENWILSIKMS